MEKRILGKTGEKLSIIGFGGIIVMNETTQDASRYVSQAIDRGIIKLIYEQITLILYKLQVYFLSVYPLLFLQNSKKNSPRTAIKFSANFLSAYYYFKNIIPQL